MRRLLLVVGLSFASAMVALAQPAAESPAAAAARKRQEAIKSIEVEFHIREVIEPGSQPGGINPKPGDKGFPEKQLVLESDNRLLLDGDNIRLEVNHPMADVSGGMYVPRKQVGVIKGDEAKSYSISTDREIRPADSMGAIKPRHRAHVADDLTMRPFMLHCRGLTPLLNWYSLGDGRWQPTGVEQTTNGTRIQQYRFALGRDYPAGSSVVGWVDPKQDYAFRRLRCDFATEHVLLEATFEQDSQSGLVLPRGWTDTRLDRNGKVLSTREHRVTSVRVNHRPTATEFELDFPPNIRLYNQFEDAHYLVRADGSLQPWTPGDADTQAIRDEAASSWWWRQRGTFALFGVVLLLGGIVTYRMRARRGRAS